MHSALLRCCCALHSTAAANVAQLLQVLRHIHQPNRCQRWDFWRPRTSWIDQIEPAGLLGHCGNGRIGRAVPPLLAAAPIGPNKLASWLVIALPQRRRPHTVELLLKLLCRPKMDVVPQPSEAVVRAGGHEPHANDRLRLRDRSWRACTLRDASRRRKLSRCKWTCTTTHAAMLPATREGRERSATRSLRRHFRIPPSDTLPLRVRVLIRVSVVSVAVRPTSYFDETRARFWTDPPSERLDERPPKSPG